MEIKRILYLYAMVIRCSFDTFVGVAIPIVNRPNTLFFFISINYVLSVVLMSKKNIAVNESDQQVSLMQIIMPSVVFKWFLL